MPKEGPTRNLEAAVAELAAFRPASEVLDATASARAPVEREIARFAHEARSVLGFARLPEPVLAWATLSPSLDPGLRRLLPEGRLELRRWEGTFTLFRRLDRRATGPEAVRLALEKLFGRAPQGPPTRQARLGERDLAEWQGDFQGGRFDCVLGVLTEKTLLFRLTPPLSPVRPERIHEQPVDVLRERMGARARPPGVTALPSPLALPTGGRFGRKSRPAKKRARS